jgi:hypothetical protein
MNISFKISIILVMLFAIVAPRCHTLSDFAGQGKAPRTWNDIMNQRVDPSRYFATPIGGHGMHPAGGYSAPSVAKADQPAAPEVKPDVKPPMPHIPLVPAPKPEVKPDCKPKPEVKPEPHKCWHFKFRTPKAKPEHKAKPDHQGPTPSNPGKDSSCGKSGDQTGDKEPGVGKHANGRGFGFGHHGHGGGKGAGHGHGKGCGRR